MAAGGRWRCLSRLCLRCCLVLDLLDVLDLPGRTAELARTYGIDFFSVINRCGVWGAGVFLWGGGRGGMWGIFQLRTGGKHTHTHLTCTVNNVTVSRCTHTNALRVSVTHTPHSFSPQGQPVPCGEHAGAPGTQPELPHALTQQGAGEAEDLESAPTALMLGQQPQQALCHCQCARSSRTHSRCA